jgi:hypothetical protein
VDPAALISEATTKRREIDNRVGAFQLTNPAGHLPDDQD